MTRLDIELELPDELAKKVKEAGLLEPRVFEELLHAELKRRSVEKLRKIQQHMPRVEHTPEFEQEIVDMVRAVRAENNKKTGD